MSDQLPAKQPPEEVVDEPGAPSETGDHGDPPAHATRSLSDDSLGAVSPSDLATDKTAASLPGGTGGGGSAAESLVGRVLDDRYEVVRKLGEGSMGVVYEVRHLRLQKRFAMKVIHGELAQVPEFIARFEREALACSRMDHINTISVTDFGHTAAGELFLVMEFVEGQSIEELVREGPLVMDQALETTRQVLLALQQAHAAGVIHRDIKPENIMRVETEDGSWRVKVLDFGIAKAPTTGHDGQLTQAGVVFGTPLYMAPEQAMSATVDARADLYAVGATLWRMLTGFPLFDGEGPVEILSAKLSRPPPSLEDEAPGMYSPQLVTFVDRALKRKPSERFGSADEMLGALVEVQAVPGGGLAVKPPKSKLTPLLVLGNRLTRRTTRLYRDWYYCAGQPGSPDWGTRLRTLFTTRSGGIAAGLAVLALVIVLGVPLLQLASLPTSEADEARGTKTHDGQGSWLPTLLSNAKVPDTKTKAAPPVPSKVQKQLIGIRMLLEKGVCREASVDLTNLVAERPGLAEAHYLLGAARFCRRQYGKALASYSEAIKLDPRYRKDVRVQEHAKTLLSKRRLKESVREQAVAFIGAHLGKNALPLLIEVASKGRNLNTRHMAITMVAKHGAASKIDWVASLGLDLDQLPSCEERCKVVERLHQLGDARAIPLLRKARDASVRYRLFRRRWKNGCCRDRIIVVIREMLARQKDGE